jgi:hypothetical protein
MEGAALFDAIRSGTSLLERRRKVMADRAALLPGESESTKVVVALYTRKGRGSMVRIAITAEALAAISATLTVFPDHLCQLDARLDGRRELVTGATGRVWASFVDFGLHVGKSDIIIVTSL